MTTEPKESAGRTAEQPIRTSMSNQRLIEAANNLVETWERQCGRVFESMGSDNPRALAIEEAAMALKQALRAIKPIREMVGQEGKA